MLSLEADFSPNFYPDGSVGPHAELGQMGWMLKRIILYAVLTKRHFIFEVIIVDIATEVVKPIVLAICGNCHIRSSSL